jgi:selenocysteine lyase/cysteine desulfurase
VYRALVMIPTTADAAEVGALLESIASSFRAGDGSRVVTRNEGALMGPAARSGEAGWILEADFLTLGDAMTALQAEGFQDTKARTEALGSTIFLFEVREV